MLRAMSAPAQTRRRLLGLGVLTAGAGALLVSAALATVSKPVVLSDPTGDVTGALDIQRAGVSLASDGRLRAVLTFAGEVTPKALLAKTGPPGSICLRIWTAADADPATSRPDRLVCVTADADEKLRANVLQQPDAGLPRRSTAAAVTAGSNGRSFVIRISQTSLGHPDIVSFAIESTRPGCDRTSCIDTVPDAGAVRRFRLR